MKQFVYFLFALKYKQKRTKWLTGAGLTVSVKESVDINEQLLIFSQCLSL